MWLVVFIYDCGDKSAMSRDDARLANLNAMLVEHSGRAEREGGSIWSVRVVIDAPTYGVALEAAEILLMPAIREADLPAERLRSVEANWVPAARGLWFGEPDP